MDIKNLAPLFLIALTAGYIFSRDFYLTKWEIARVEGQRLLFESAFWGIVLILFSWLSFVVLDFLTQLQALSFLFDNRLESFLTKHILHQMPMIPGLAVFLVTIFWGKALPKILNYFLDENIASEILIDKYGNHLEKLMEKAMSSSRMVSISLKNGKVYIGWPLRTTYLVKGGNQYIRILPAVSGHRSQDTHALTLTTQYLEIYKKMEAQVDERESFQEGEGLAIDDFEKVIRGDEIVTANIYSLSIDQDLFSISEVKKSRDRRPAEGSDSSHPKENNEQTRPLPVA